MTTIETVQQIYAAFGRGDVPFILAKLADDVQWEYATFPNPVPWLQPLQGRDQVPRFFQALAEGVEFHSFQPTKVFGDATTAVSLCDLDATVRSTGKRVVEVDEVHVWHFDAAGRVQRFRHRCDTRQQALALQGD
jgi:ketosteroid isomerase-like protein